MRVPHGRPIHRPQTRPSASRRASGRSCNDEQIKPGRPLQGDVHIESDVPVATTLPETGRRRAQDAAASMLRNRGWRHKRLSGVDPAVDAATLADVVLGAPDGVASTQLRIAAFERAPQPDLPAAVTRPAELLWIRPYLLACWASSSALPDSPPMSEHERQ